MNSTTVLHPGPPDTRSYKVNIANSTQWRQDSKRMSQECPERARSRQPPLPFSYWARSRQHPPTFCIGSEADSTPSPHPHHPSHTHLLCPPPPPKPGSAAATGATTGTPSSKVHDQVRQGPPVCLFLEPVSAEQRPLKIHRWLAELVVAFYFQ